MTTKAATLSVSDDDILAGLEFEEDVDTSDVVDLSKKTNQELMFIMVSAREALKDMGERLHPTSQEARDLHSIHYACKIELSNRGVI